MKPRVYVAGPYTKPDPVANVDRAVDLAAELIDEGFIVYVPHLSHYIESRYPRHYEVWMEQCLSWVRECNFVLRIPGESPGADREVALANRLGIKVVHSKEELKALSAKDT